MLICTCRATQNAVGSCGHWLMLQCKMRISYLLAYHVLQQSIPGMKGVTSFDPLLHAVLAKTYNRQYSMKITYDIVLTQNWPSVEPATIKLDSESRLFFKNEVLK